MNKNKIILWGHSTQRDRIDYYATELTICSIHSPYDKDCQWKVTAVSKGSHLKLGDIINISRDWEYGWIIISNAIKRGDQVVSGLEISEY